MSEYNDDAFGGLWDLGEVVTPDAITYPIRRLIRRDAEKAGIVPVAYAYEFGNHGLEFNIPAILQICYNQSTLSPSEAVHTLRKYT